MDAADPEIVDQILEMSTPTTVAAGAAREPSLENARAQPRCLPLITRCETNVNNS